VEQPAARANDRRTADPPRLRERKLRLGFTRTAAALVGSAPWDKTAAAAVSAVAGPGALTAASRATAALVQRPLGVIPEGASSTVGNTSGGALGQDEAVVYIPGGLRTRCCLLHLVYISIDQSINLSFLLSSICLSIYSTN